MKIISIRLVVLCSIAVFASFVLNRFLDYSKDSSLQQVSTKELEFVASEYNSIISNIESDLFERSLHESGYVSYHMGVMFPWDKNVDHSKHLSDRAACVEFIHSMELSRSRYGFLFLNNPVKSSRVLDAGCGAGIAAILMSKQFDCYVDGYTLGEKEAEYGKKIAEAQHCSSKLRFLVGDMLHLPEKSDTYDAIWSSESAEYAASLDDLFKEFKRVGKNNARLVIFVTCSISEKIKSDLDLAYGLKLHSVNDFLISAEKYNFNLAHKQDLSDWVIPYWKFIAESKIPCGEQDYVDGYPRGDLQYYLLCFDLKK